MANLNTGDLSKVDAAASASCQHCIPLATDAANVDANAAISGSHWEEPALRTESCNPHRDIPTASATSDSSVSDELPQNGIVGAPNKKSKDVSQTHGSSAAFNVTLKTP